MPGTDVAEAIAVVLGELAEFAHLPELPARGPGADMIGRTAGLLVDMPVQTTPRGWQLAARTGRGLRRARTCWPPTSTHSKWRPPITRGVSRSGDRPVDTVGLGCTAAPSPRWPTRAPWPI
jgi:hypothetical protein